MLDLELSASDGYGTIHDIPVILTGSGKCHVPLDDVPLEVLMAAKQPGKPDSDVDEATFYL